MKSIIVYISLLFFVLSDVYAQPCLQNGSFRDACSDEVTDGCREATTWADHCGNGWVRSHGTPQMIFYTDPPPKPNPGFYAYMWSRINVNGHLGEGMFTPYTFLANRAYYVTLYMSTSHANGSVLVYAANGLTQSDLNTTCFGGDIPNIASQQLIGQYTGLANAWTEVKFTFIANANYSQLWIYPLTSDGTQYDLAVKSVDACQSCEAIMVYNNGVVPTGESRAGTIQAGSSAGSGGSGTVTINPTANTTFISTKEIVLLPNFEATVTSGSFSAQVYNCWMLPPRMIVDSNNFQVPWHELGDRITTKPETNSKQNDQQIQVYPSVGTGLVYISGGFKELENVEISVFDQSGRQLLRTPKSTYSKTTLDLGHFKNGIYILQIRQSSKTVTKKIIIQK